MIANPFRFCALLAVLLSFAWPRTAHAQDVIRACYTPSGVLYIIGVPGQPDACRANHTEVSWGTASPSKVSFTTGSAQEEAPDVASPLLSVSFSTSESGPAVVSFFANVAQSSFATTSSLFFVLNVDGQDLLQVRHDAESPDRDAQMIGMDWPLELDAGAHTVTVLWWGASNNNNNPTVDDRSLIVRHAP